MTDSVPPPPPPPNDPYGQSGYAGPAGPTGTQPPSVGARIGARIIDFLIVGIVTNVITSIATGSSMLDPNRSYGDDAITAVIGGVLYLAYFTLGESLRGQTPGKALLKLQVQGPDGKAPSAAEAAKRNLWTALNIFGLLGLVGSFIAGIAGLVIIILLIVQAASAENGGVTFMDKFAGGTRVVKKG